MKTLFQYTIEPYEILIMEEQEAISSLSIRSSHQNIPMEGVVKETPLIHKAYVQLVEYFKGERTQFTLPLLIRGTEFQQKVYHALLTIAYGETASYKDVAQQVGSPKAYRAVGNASNKNPIGIIVPCHRVIGSDGSLVGYASGLEIKQYLLQMEHSKSDINKP